MIPVKKNLAHVCKKFITRAATTTENIHISGGIRNAFILNSPRRIRVTLGGGGGVAAAAKVQ